MTPSGIEPATFRFVEQHLNHSATAVSIDNIWRIRNNMDIDELMEGTDIVRFIKTQRIICQGAYPTNGPSKTK